MAKRKKKTKKVRIRASAAVAGEDDGEEERGALGMGMSLRRPWSRLVESVYTGTNPDAGTEFDDRFYASLDTAAIVDLPAEFLHAAQRLSLLLYRKNVRAYRSVELVKDFVLGDGVKFSASDQKVEELLRQHWQVNRWKNKAAERLRALALFGEQLWPAFVSEGTGLVRLSSVSPLLIRAVKRDPENAEEIIAAETGPTDANKKNKRSWDVIREGEDGKLVGEAFYFPVNRIAGGGRGTPDLLSSIDWLEGLDNMVFGMLERSALALDVVFDLELEQTNETEIRKHVKDFVKSLRSGGVYGHNERVKLDIKAPALGATEAQTAIGILLRQIQSGTGLAGLFFGDSADLTRSSASELSVPVAKMIQGRQEVFRRMLDDVFRFQIEKAKEAGALNGVDDFSYDIQMAPVYLRDVQAIAAALGQLASALSVAQEEGWVSNADAGTVFRAALTQLRPVDDAPDDLAEASKGSIYRKVLDERHATASATYGS